MSRASFLSLTMILFSRLMPPRESSSWDYFPIQCCRQQIYCSTGSRLRYCLLDFLWSCLGQRTYRLGRIKYSILNSLEIALMLSMPFMVIYYGSLKLCYVCNSFPLSAHCETNSSAPTKRVMSLKEPHVKMSKSNEDNRSRININDCAEDIAKKIRLAVTDSIPGVTHDTKNRPGVANLLELMSSFDCQARTADQLAKDCSIMSMREFKAKVTVTINDGLACIRERYQRLVAADNSHYLEDVADHGAAQARKQAMWTMDKVRKAVGLSWTRDRERMLCYWITSKTFGANLVLE